MFIQAVGRGFVGRSQVDDDDSPAPSIPTWVAGPAVRPMELKRFSNTPRLGAAELLKAACHTLMAIWLDETAVRTDDFVRWLGAAWNAVEKSAGKHGLVLATADERLRDQFLSRAGDLQIASLANCQVLSWEQFGEKAGVRPPRPFSLWRSHGSFSAMD